MSSHEIEDGMGFSGLAPTAEERRHGTYLKARDAIARKREDRIRTLGALLRLHRCNSDGNRSVGECVDAGACGCSCGLLLAERPALPEQEET